MAHIADDFESGVANWSTVRGDTGLQVVDGAVRVNTNTNGNVRNDLRIGSGDMVVDVRVTDIPNSVNCAAFVMSRCAAGTGTGAQTYYALQTHRQAQTYAVLKYSNAAATPLASNVPTTVPTPPYRMRIEVQGAVVRAYIDDLLLGTWTDTSPLPASDMAGIGFHNAQAGVFMDDFRAFHIGPQNDLLLSAV